MINIKGTVVTLDAMSCQQKIVEKIVDQKADYVITYVITVKKNQPGIKSIGMVYRHREPVNDKNPRAVPETDHVTHFISSLPPTAKLVAKYVDKHWSVENSLHWTPDVTFTEDSSRIRKGSAPAIMASLRRFALSLLRRDTSMPKTSIKRKRKRAAMNSDNLEAVLFGY